MTRGRKPKPTNLKLVTGTSRADRRNAKEPQPAPSIPAPPEHLSDAAAEEWARVSERLFNLGTLSEIDRGALAAYCQAYGRWVQAERALARMAKSDPVTSGLVIKTQSGNAIQNPLVGAANKAMADMVRYAAEFGMTPSARSRVQAEREKQDGDPAARFFS